MQRGLKRARGATSEGEGEGEEEEALPFPVPEVSPIQVPLSGAPQTDLLMGKVVVKTEEAPQQQREILVNVVSTGSGTDFILLRPEDLPGGTPPAAAAAACKAQRFYQQQPVALSAGLEAVANATAAWAPNPAKLLSSLSATASAGEINGRNTANGGGGGIRYCSAGNNNNSMAIDGGVYAEGTVVERPPLGAPDAAGGAQGLREAQVLVRPVDGKPVEALPLATVDAYPIRPYVRGLVELPSFDEGFRQRSHWGQYSHLSPREKNRQAQRRFRERQKSRVLSLQKEVQRLNAENACLRSDLSKSQADKERLVQVVSNLMQRLDKDQGKQGRN